MAVAGDAAPAVAARLAARDADVMLTDARLPLARHVAVVAERRFRGSCGRCPRSRSMSIRQRRGCLPAACAARPPDDRSQRPWPMRPRWRRSTPRRFRPREAWSEDAIALQLALPGAFGLIDECGGMLLGRVAADEAEVLTLAVAPSARRRGLATALLRAAGAHVGGCGGNALFLEVATAILPHCRSTGARASSRWAGGGATTPIRRMRWCSA